jgi:predicted permease
LIIGEVAFALVLLTGAGLFLLGLRRFANLDPGWRVDGLLSARIGLRGANYATPAQRNAFYKGLEERLRVLPGVQQVALSNSQPVYGFNSSGGFVIEGQPEPPPGQFPEVYFEPVSPHYFETLGVRLLAGRAFSATDTTDKTAVIIINETMARRFWPNESPIGKRIGRSGNRDWQEVVGVVNDIRFPASIGDPYTRFQAFRPLAQSSPGSVAINLRTSASPESLASALRKAGAEIDPNQPIHRIRTVRSLMDQALGSVSLLGTLLGLFAAIGVGLAAIGIYGVIAYTVAQRQGEIGIRMALGAQRKDVIRLVLGGGARPIAFGALLGVGGAYAVARFLAASIPSLPTRDPVAFIILALSLIVVALAACYLPARRATRIDPMIALRSE